MSRSLRKRAGKKIGLVLISILLFLFLFAPASSAAMLGDVDGNGVINVNDVVKAMKHFLDIPGAELSADQFLRADVNVDNKVNVQDVALIMQYSLGIIDEFPAPATLAVSKVTAVNLKQVEVLFNRAVTASERTKMVPANFHVGLQASPAVDRLPGAVGDGSAVEVLLDNRTVLLTIQNGQQFVNYTTTNRVVVKKEVGLAADYVDAAVVANDIAVPAMVKARAEGIRNIAITFSEPLDRSVSAADTIASLRINDGAIGLLTAATYIDAKRELHIITAADLSGTVKVTVLAAPNNLIGYDGRTVAPGSVTFQYVAPTDAPKVSVKESTPFSVTLEFNRNVQNTKAATTFYSWGFNFVGNANQVAGNTAGVVQVDDRTVAVTFANPMPPGNSNFYIYYAAATPDANKIKDYFNNVLPPTQLVVSNPVDTDKPIVESVSYNTTKERVIVTFSKPVEAGTGTNGAERLSNYTLRDSLNDPIIITAAAFQSTPTASTRIIELAVNEAGTGKLKGGSYNLEVANISDRALPPNTMLPQTIAFTAEDKIPPTVLSAVLVSGSDKKVRVNFSEPMDPASITDYTMYFYHEADPASVAQISADTNLTAAPGNRSVLLDFTGVVPAVTLAAGQHLHVGRVKDAAGNMTTNLVTPLVIAAAANYTAADIHSVQATARKEVALIMNALISGVVAADFGIDPGTGTYADAASVKSVTQGAGKTTIVLETAVDLPYNAAAVRIRTQSASGVAGATGGAKDVDNNRILFNNVAVADRIIPVLAATDPIQTMDVNGNGRIDHIRVEFVELMRLASIAPSQFSVAGYYVLDAYAATAPPTVPATPGSFDASRQSAVLENSVYIYIAVEEKPAQDYTSQPIVNITSGPQDLELNLFAGATNKTAKALTYATVTFTTTGNNDGAIAAGETLVLTFSKAMNHITIDETNINSILVPSGGKTHLDGDGSIGSAVWSVDNTVLTITYSAGTSIPTLEAGDTITVSSAIKDSMGNALLAPTVYTIAANDF